jgi:hypothetical protein
MTSHLISPKTGILMQTFVHAIFAVKLLSPLSSSQLKAGFPTDAVRLFLDSVVPQ